MSKISLVMIGLVFLFATSALAETYTWVDSSGTVNFSDDLSQVPKKYRKKVKVLGDMGPGMPATVESSEAAPASKEKGEAAKDSGKGNAAKSDKKDALYGGKSGPSWKQEFDTLRDQIASVDQQMDLNTKRMQQGNMSRSEYLGIEHGNRLLQEKRKELSGKLESLNEAATKAGLPSEFR